ncbi:tyrosine-type recombinase/integrase [Acidipropionibacterium acidipropionici]|uniref:tyrosine-type recombinase/integrase n=1 Tax=Acidipropionibacterium acidipropionici TaxID=1748 RepID=UPI00110B8E1F|nr:site-specific integrase [Acidipropionibacterium acidipropionici]QCV95638.1 site-specific integrase [Acidipropionibacterium acidipropionici]
MAVQDLWTNRRGEHTARYGRGLRYRVVVRGYPSTACRTKAEAESLNAERIVKGPPAARSAELVDDAVELWVASKRGLSKSGRTSAREAAGHVLRRWRGVQIDDVDVREVRAWIAGLETTRGTPASHALRSNVLQCLRGAIGDRVDLSSVTAGRKTRRAARFLSVPELSALAGAVGAHDAPMVWLLGTTGLRVGEACALDVWHVDRRRRRLHVVTSKNGEDRWVPIAASVLGMLDLSRGRTDPLLTNSRGGRVDKDNWRARVFRPAVEEAGLGAVRIHDLRHTAASLAIASGADVKAVQRMLGHRSAKMTLDLYGHLWDAALDDVAARVDGVIRAER